MKLDVNEKMIMMTEQEEQRWLQDSYDVTVLREAASLIERRRLAKHGRMNFASLTVVKLLRKIAASIEKEER